MKITVAVDIMGGDKPASELAAGAVNAANEFASQGLHLILVGTQDAIDALGTLPANITTRVGNSVVEMTDDPGIVMKEKNDSTLAVACKLCREGEADAVVIQAVEQLEELVGGNAAQDGDELGFVKKFVEIHGLILSA